MNQFYFNKEDLQDYTLINNEGTEQTGGMKRCRKRNKPQVQIEQVEEAEETVKKKKTIDGTPLEIMQTYCMKRSQKVVFPMKIEGIKVYACFDTLAEASLISTNLAKLMGLMTKKVNVRVTCFKGADPVLITEMVEVTSRVPGFQKAMNLLLYPFDIGKIIIGEKDAANLGIYVDGLPAIHDEEEKESDEAWAEVKNEKGEVQPTPEEKAVITEIVKEAMRDNQTLPNSTFCTHPAARHDIAISDSTIPIATRQYPIARKFKAKTGERIQEWSDNDWTEADEPGNPWNSPVNPRPKISGGKRDGDDIRLCMDLRGPNTKSGGADFLIPLNEYQN